MNHNEIMTKLQAISLDRVADYERLIRSEMQSSFNIGGPSITVLEAARGFAQRKYAEDVSRWLEVFQYEESPAKRRLTSEMILESPREAGAWAIAMLVHEKESEVINKEIDKLLDEGDEDE